MNVCPPCGGAGSELNDLCRLGEGADLGRGVLQPVDLRVAVAGLVHALQGFVEVAGQQAGDNGGQTVEQHDAENLLLLGVHKNSSCKRWYEQG